RLCHWVAAGSLLVLTMSGLAIFRAFPSFGAKIPEHVLLDVPSAVTLGGWLGGALQWHLTFMWVFTATGAVYVVYHLASANVSQVAFRRADVAGVAPMVRHYLLRAPAPTETGTYNPLQKLAYTVVLALGAVSVATGAALWKPVQLGWLVALLGGFRLVRAWHF